jgi:hypothetical protein
VGDGAEHGHADAHAHGDEHAHDDEHAHHDEHAHDERSDGAAHSEFRADYTLACAAPEALDRLAFPYFERFPNARAIDVTLVDARGARRFEATPARPELDLGGGG